MSETKREASWRARREMQDEVRAALDRLGEANRAYLAARADYNLMLKIEAQVIRENVDLYRDKV